MFDRLLAPRRDRRRNEARRQVLPVACRRTLDAMRSDPDRGWLIYGDLDAATGLGSAALYGALPLLEDAGSVERRYDANDRYALYYLTDSGRSR